MTDTITLRVVKNARKRGVIVLNRDQWGTTSESTYHDRRVNKPVRPGVFGQYAPADTVVQHISVTRPGDDVDAAMRLLERIGNQRFGSGVSYNFAVFPNGDVCVGQPLDAKGTHTVNDKNVPGFSHDQNYWARAIVFVGMPGDQLTKAAEHSIVQLLKAMVQEKAITPGFDYLPHSKFAFKSCPTWAVRRKMWGIRRKVNRVS